MLINYYILVEEYLNTPINSLDEVIKKEIESKVGTRLYLKIESQSISKVEGILSLKGCYRLIK